MSLDPKDLEELSKLIRTVVRQELKSYSHPCRFTSITDTDAKQASHYLGMVKDLGNNDLSKGIEVMRDNHKWFNTLRSRGDKISTAFMVAFTAAVVSATIGAVWVGIKKMITG